MYTHITPKKKKITSSLSNLSTALEKICIDYENIILQGDFNVEVEKNMSEFMSADNLRNLVKQKTCFKNPQNPLSIDLILTNEVYFPRFLKRDSLIFKNLQLQF